MNAIHSTSANRGRVTAIQGKLQQERTLATRHDGVASAAPPTPAAVLAGRYRLRAMLGTGGMGSVYLATDEELGELVAVKMLHAYGAHEALFMDRMKNEVKLARRVTHPNVARIFDIGEADGSRFLTMEYVSGESLGAKIAREGPFDVPAFLRIASDVASGLAAAHAAGVLHRDLKPANVLLTGGKAKIADFGAAWPLDEAPEGVVVGTPSYMAPEQFEARFDARSDVFGLGAIFYTMLTGSRPFVNQTPAERPVRAPNPRDLRPELPVPLGALVARCLEPSPERRYESANAVGAALAGLASSLQDDEQAPPTVVSSPAERVLFAVDSGPRYVRLEASSEDAGLSLVVALRGQVADRVNELDGVRAVEDGRQAAEATAHMRLRREGDTVVLDVQLVGSREGLEFWSASFTGARGEMMALAREAAVGIGAALAVAGPGPLQHAPLGREAEDLFMRGRAAFREFWPEPVSRAADLYEQALAHAPGHPVVIAALAAAQARKCFFLDGSQARAREASELAVRLAPDLAESHVARSAVHLLDSDAERALPSLLRALELAPGHGEALAQLAALTLEVGAPVAAVRLSEAAAARHPDGDEVLITIARAHALLGRWADAAAALERLRPQWAVQLGLLHTARFATWRRDRETARAVERRIAAEAPGDGTPMKLAHRGTNLFVGAVLHGRAPTEDPDFRRRLTSQSAPRRTRAFTAQLNAEMQAYLGDHGQALSALEASVDNGLFDAFWFDRCPLFDELRGTSRFEEARDVVLSRARRVRAGLYPSIS